MLARLAADTVLVVHLLFIGFVVLGGFLARRSRWLLGVHAAALVYGVVIQSLGFVCPLTPLENDLRRAAGESGYDAGFVEHYLVAVIYPGEMTPAVRTALIAGLVAISAAAYAPVLRRVHQGAVEKPPSTAIT